MWASRPLVLGHMFLWAEILGSPLRPEAQQGPENTVVEWEESGGEGAPKSAESTLGVPLAHLLPDSPPVITTSTSFSGRWVRS